METIRRFLSRPGFNELTTRHQTRHQQKGILRDVYNGRMWRQFKNFMGVDFHNQERRLGLMLNLEWFQPFHHSPYSVGVLFVTIMNLPREEQYKNRMTFLLEFWVFSRSFRKTRLSQMFERVCLW